MLKFTDNIPISCGPKKKFEKMFDDGSREKYVIFLIIFFISMKQNNALT